MLLLEAAKKKAAKKKSKKSPAKKAEKKPKVEAPVEPETDPVTGQEVEVTKPAKAMTGNPANQVVVYPNTGAGKVPGELTSPKNDTTQLLQSHTETPGMLLKEYIDFALGKIGGIDASIPTQGNRDTENQHTDHTGEVGFDDAGSEDDTVPDGTPGKMGDVNQRLRRKAGKTKDNYDGIPGVWGGDDADYAHTENGPLIENMIYDSPKFTIHKSGDSHVVTDKDVQHSMTLKPGDIDEIESHSMKDGKHDTHIANFWRDHIGQRTVNEL